MASFTAPHLPEPWIDTDTTELDNFAVGYDNATESGTEVSSVSSTHNILLMY